MKTNTIKIYKGRKEKYYDRFEDTIKYIPIEKWKKFIQFVKEKEDKNRKRNILIFQLLLSTGMRIGEFSLIKINDIDFEESVIHIPFENTKTKKRRTARVKKEILLDLKEYLLNNNIKSGFIFRNKKNKPLSTRYYQKLFDKYFLNPNLDLNLNFKPSPHTLRHCHIIYALQQGVSINAVKEQVGHFHITTTEIYSKISAKEVKTAYDNFEF
jgi:integrase